MAILLQPKAPQAAAKEAETQPEAAPVASQRLELNRQPDYDSPPQNLKDLLERYVNAQSSPEHIQKINSMRIIGEIIEGDQTLRFVQIKRTPNLSRVSLEQGHNSIATFTNGEQTWRIINDGPEAYRLTGDEAARARASGRIFNALWTDRNKPDALKMLSDEPLDGKRHHRVQALNANGAEEIYWLDPETYLETQLVVYEPNGREVVTRFSDYRKVRWIHVPFHVEVYVNGELKSTFEIEKIEINIGVFESYFAPPQFTSDWPPPKTPTN